MEYETALMRNGFRTFLQEHAALLRFAPTWTLRIAFPRPVYVVYDAYQRVIHEELESPLHPATIGELEWHFEHRRKADLDEPIHPLTQGFLNAGTKAYATPKFDAMYHRWLKHGNAVFEGPSSPVIADALTTGAGRVETLVLPYGYRHLSPLVDQPRPRARSNLPRLQRFAVVGRASHGAAFCAAPCHRRCQRRNGTET